MVVPPLDLPSPDAFPLPLPPYLGFGGIVVGTSPSQFASAENSASAD